MTKNMSSMQLALIVCFVAALCTVRGSSQTLQWSPAERYDDGKESSVAVHGSGLILEVHPNARFWAARAVVPRGTAERYECDVGRKPSDSLGRKLAECGHQ